MAYVGWKVIASYFPVNVNGGIKTSRRQLALEACNSVNKEVPFTTPRADIVRTTKMKNESAMISIHSHARLHFCNRWFLCEKKCANNRDMEIDGVWIYDVNLRTVYNMAIFFEPKTTNY